RLPGQRVVRPSRGSAPAALATGALPTLEVVQYAPPSRRPTLPHDQADGAQGEPSQKQQVLPQPAHEPLDNALRWMGAAPHHSSEAFCGGTRRGRSPPPYPMTGGMVTHVTHCHLCCQKAYVALTGVRTTP